MFLSLAIHSLVKTMDVTHIKFVPLKLYQMTHLSAFLNMQEWPNNLYMLQNNKSARKITFIPIDVPH